ncbi:MAG: sodium-dependent transporter [Bacteroidales bacterium]|nr:sodium-dependent transporter [Bacteroidales bacterium]
MAQLNPNLRDGFGSKLGVIAAAAGSAVGLGNIWRFPYVVGQNGGGAFLLVYLLFILVIGVPVMLSEFVVGRRSQRNALGAFKKLAPGTYWHVIGIMGIGAAFFILSFYTTVSGWTLEYLVFSLSSSFEGMDKEGLNVMFEQFRMSGLKPLIYQMIFMFFTAFIVFKGVKNGIEKYTKLLMPALLLIIVVLCVRAVTLPGAGEGLVFLFKPDFTKITGDVVLQALGQAFFSLSIGMGALITYGSYINSENNLSNSAFSVTLTDTLVAVLAGVAIFPAVFAFGIQPEAGPGLVFITLPMIFEQMAGGYFFSLIFFLLLVIAALTSTISVLEVVVAYVSEELGMNRKKATVLSALSISLLGVFCTLSQGPMPEIHIGNRNLFDVLEFASANIMLPLGGLLIVLFVGWYMKDEAVFDEISNKNKLKVRFKWLYLYIIKFVAPVAIALVFLNGLGFFGAFSN